MPSEIAACIASARSFTSFSPCSKSSTPATLPCKIKVLKRGSGHGRSRGHGRGGGRGGGHGGSTRGSAAAEKKNWIFRDFDDFSDLSIFSMFFEVFAINLKSYEFLDLAK